MRSSGEPALRSEDKPKGLSKNHRTSQTRVCTRGIWSILKNESGQALVLAAVCMPVLIGAMALAVDVGYIHYRQYQLQTAADSAALAAGLELGNCANTVCSNMQTAAAQALIEDGITTSTITPTSSCTVSSSTGLAMIINVAPCVMGSADPNDGNTHVAEVVLTEPQNTFFGAILGLRTVNLEVRAEAGDSYINTANSGGNCIYTKSLEYNSSDGIFTLNNCGLYDNGNLQTNNGDSVKATSFLYYGTWSPNNCNNSCTWTLGSSETQPTHTTTAQSDPLASLTPPSQPATSSTNTQTPNNGATLQPGYYPNGFNLNSNVSVTLSPGLYYMNGSINVNSGATLSGTGVELYFENGTLQLNSGSTAQLTAPTTTSATAGTTAGMLDWQASNNSSGMDIDSGSTSYFQGVIYLPDAELTLNSGSNVTLNSGASYTAIDVQNLMVNSGENFVINGSGGYLGGTSSQTLGTFALAE
ncbi:MAG TPA: Tad domain-containing protein [Acidobacteriaceae bacterium]|nr:Tad domain-containing protein [Acidobacteriaceae bacterium]